jgi:hypothetical protein
VTPGHAWLQGIKPSCRSQRSTWTATRCWGAQFVSQLHQASELAASSAKGPPSLGLAVAACNCGLIPSHLAFPRCPSIHPTSLRRNVELDVMTLRLHLPFPNSFRVSHHVYADRDLDAPFEPYPQCLLWPRHLAEEGLHYRRISFSASATPSRA